MPTANPTYYKTAWPAPGGGWLVSRLCRSRGAAVAFVPAGEAAQAYIFETEAPTAARAERTSLWDGSKWFRRPVQGPWRPNAPRRRRISTAYKRPRARRRWRPLPNPRRIDWPRHFLWKRNPDAETMRRVLHGYQARGQRVFLGEPDMDMSCRVEKQLTGGPMALFTVVLDTTIGQEDYEAALGLPGGSAGKVFEQAAREGRLDRLGALKRITTPWSYLSLDVHRAGRGALTEYQTEDRRNVTSMRDTPGRIVGRADGVGRGGESVIFMEVFEPLSFWQLPAGMALEHSRAGFSSKTAYFMDGTNRETLAQVRPDILKQFGPMRAVDDLYYALEEPLPMDRAETLVKPVLGDLGQPGIREAWALHFILPLWQGGNAQKGWFRPMREDLAKGLETEVWAGADWLEGLE